VASRSIQAGGERTAREKSYLYWLFVGAFLAATSGVFFANPGFLQSLRYIVFDAYQKLAPANAAASSPVRIVDIDEDSLARLGQWPWPRSTMARLTDALGADGARAIAFDTMFTEPDRTSPEQMLRWLEPQQAASIRTAVSNWPTNDGVFAQSIARNPTVLAATLNARRGSESFPRKAGIVVAGDDPGAFLYGFTGLSGNLPALTAAAHGVGSINWVPDRDQIVRRIPLVFRQGDVIAPSLVLEALRVAGGQSTYLVRSSNAHGETAFGKRAGVNEIRIGEHAIPTDARGAVWIRFRPSDRRDYIPAWRVLAGQVDASEIEGRIILIGASASGLLDLRATPLDAAIPGVEIHQQALEQILAGRFLTRPDYAPALEFLIGVGAVLLLAFASPRLSASAGAMLGGALILTMIGLSVWAYLGAGQLFDPIFPAAGAFLFATGSGLYLYQQTERQRAEIRNAFSRYLSPSVVKQLAAHPEKLTLGGEVRDLTLLLCDVRNFTGISEGLSAAQLTTFINSLLTPLTEIIIENGGTVDKYMGDAIMAFWNAPIDDPEHARHACAAATAISAKMADLNALWRQEAAAAGRPFAQVLLGIGVNSGECCVGNLGSMHRFDYSAIGDNVNITARLEGLTKVYGVTLVVGEETARRLPDVSFLEVDLVRVKGRSAPSRIFTPRATLDIGGADWDELKGMHERFLAAYRTGGWAEAQVLLAELRERRVESLAKLYEVYAERLNQLSANPPENWDGVYGLDEK
jgi:adenylate cyclase